jgi:hypothetical protein
VKTPLKSVLVVAVLAAAPGPATAQVVIAKWDFNTIGTQGPPYNSPPPTTGTGVATMLGMTNGYNGGNTASGDALLTAGTANPAFSENTWRIRGTANNGWATHQAGAAQYTQGIELDTSTVGFTGIRFSFDWYSTTQGIRDLQFQYNTNGNNAAGWTNFGGTSPTGTYTATSNDYYNAPGSPTITIDLSSVAGAANDPNFGVRLVSAYDSTGHVTGTAGPDYASAVLSGGQTVIYNNTSGNWRFDNLTFTGVTPVPEPSSVALGLAAGGAFGLARWRHRRRNSDPRAAASLTAGATHRADPKSRRRETTVAHMPGGRRCHAG